MRLTKQEKDRIENIAFGIREKHKIKDVPIDVKKIAEENNIQLFQADLDNIQGYNLSGYIRKIPEGMKIVINKNHADTRNNFTIAHELGHYFLGHLNGKDNVVSLRGGEKTQIELESDYFAVALLMPKELILKHKAEWYKKGELPTLTEWAELFNVGRMTMFYRLKGLGVGFYGF